MRRLFAIVGFLALGASVRCAEQPFDFDTADGHLPRTVVPTHYTVRLEPDLPARTFAGHVRIEITARENVNVIVMNANAIEIDDAVLITPTGRIALSATLDPLTEQLHLALAEPLQPGDYALELDYRGVIHSNPEGFFFDRYATADGEEEMFGTQCQVKDARRLLPCWDEPAFKATFDSTLVVPASFTASSNMPALSETILDDGRKAVTFARTPRMSTYLLAYFGGEFEVLETEHRGVRLRVLTTAGKRERGAYALEITAAILDACADYFGVAYPLPQLDQIAVPNAFDAFGAMENWGCISYLESLLLYDPVTSSHDTKEAIFATVAHELAHQWFGNLVTMGWWDNLWLNEGFASWMETKISDQFNPQWQPWLRANRDKERALGLDARSSTHAIQLPGVSESTANDAFDTISYEKGRAFIRMVEDYIGEVPFRDGLRRYMARHPYGNTTTADLWNAISEASGQPVASLTRTWTEQPGFPIISARVTDGALHLSQKRFILDAPEPDLSQWDVPITLAPIDDLDHPSRHLLRAGSPLTLPWPADRGAPKLNLADAGFYRVLYDDRTLAAITAALPNLPAADQLNLLGDTHALVTAGHLASPDYLELAVALHESTSQPVWKSIIDTLSSIDTWLRGQPEREDFHRWCVNLLHPQLQRLGWEPQPGESVLADVLRTDLIYRLGWFGDATVIAECQRRFRTSVDDPMSLTGSLRDAVISVVGRYADTSTYEQLLARARTASGTEEQHAYFNAAQHALDPALATRTLELTLGEHLGVAERNYNIMEVASVGEHLDLAWTFGQEHATTLLATLADLGANSYLANIVSTASDRRYADELETLTVKYRGESALPEAQKTSSLIRVRAALLEREAPVLRAWLARHLAPHN